MRIQLMMNGDLEMSLTKNEIREFKRQFKHLNIQTSTMERVFVFDWLNPLGYKYVKPEDCGALTSATLIADGKEVWGDMQYQVKSFMETLRDGGTVTWTKG